MDLRRALARGAVATLLIVGGAGCGGDQEDPTDLAAAERSTTTTERVTTSTTTKRTTTTTTTQPTTTTTSVEQALGAALSVQIGAVHADEGRYGEQDLDIGFDLANLSPKVIVAWQAIIDVRATDALGRSFTWRLRMDCTDGPPLPAGATRAHPSPSDDSLPGLEARIAGYEDCTLGSWDANPYIEEEDGVWDAVREGGAVDPQVRLTRVTFDDGTGIGTAV